jgi:DNA replication and repair protein RecF
VRFLEIRPRQLRNLVRDTRFTPDARFNVITGKNAQGKTNLLEAVYLVATLKPLRAARVGELVRWGETQGAVAATAEVEGLHRDFQVEIVAGRRSARIDGKPAGGPGSYLARAVSVIAFIPEDLDIAKGGPATRRLYLDRAIFGWDATYLPLLRVYLKTLRQRTALLRVSHLGAIDRAQLDVFDQALARQGAAVAARRVAFLDAVRPFFQEVHARIAAGNPAEPAVAYAGSADETELLHRLGERLPRDHATGATSVGAHRDDLVLTLDGRPLRHMASQGQQRTVILALKIAEIALARASRRGAPVLLLDDVAGELDRARAEALFDHLRALHEGQVVVTTTDRERVPLGASEGVCEWVVEAGVLRPASPNLSP